MKTCNCNSRSHYSGWHGSIQNRSLMIFCGCAPLLLLINLLLLEINLFIYFYLVILSPIIHMRPTYSTLTILLLSLCLHFSLGVDITGSILLLLVLLR